MTKTITTTGQNITVYPSNGDKQGLNPDANNIIVITGLESGQGFTVDPNSTDKIVSVITEIVE